MSKKHVRIGWTLYTEDMYGNYLDFDGYNIEGFKYNGNEWIDRYNNKATRYFKKENSDEEYIYYVLDNERFFQWTIQLSKIENL